jgi:hypothetical protein
MSEEDLGQCYNHIYSHLLIGFHDASIARDPHKAGVSPLAAAVCAGAVSTVTEWQMHVHLATTLWKKN